jgi:plastocyanin
MIWRWLTCSSLLAAGAFAASVSGTVQLRDSRLDAVSKHGDYSGVVVSLAPLDKSAEAPAASSPRRFRMLQKNKMFTPHVLPVSTGSTVEFPNADPIFHNAFSSYSGQIFDVGLYAPGTTRSVRFTRAGIVRVFCNIHPAMSAIILVLDTPYFATTAADGSFHLDVPPGEYQLNVFHERATDAALKSLSRRVTIGDTPVRLPGIAVSESGYLLAPHKNKYGNDYPPEAGNEALYPGAKK